MSSKANKRGARAYLKSHSAGKGKDRSRDATASTRKIARIMARTGMSFPQANSAYYADSSSRSQFCSELKGVDFRTAFSPVISTTNDSGCIHTINLVGAGTGSFQRIGKNVCGKSVRLQGIVAAILKTDGTTGDLLGNTLRMVVVYDAQPNGNLPVYSDIFGITGQDGTVTTEFLDPVRYTETSRFKVLRNVVWDCNPEAYGSTGSQHQIGMFKTIDEYIPLDDITTTFSANTSPASISQITHGAIYLIFRARSNTTDDYFYVSDKFSVRYRYTD